MVFGVRTTTSTVWGEVLLILRVQQWIWFQGSCTCRARIFAGRLWASILVKSAHSVIDYDSTPVHSTPHHPLSLKLESPQQLLVPVRFWCGEYLTVLRYYACLTTFFTLFFRILTCLALVIRATSPEPEFLPPKQHHLPVVCCQS